MRRNLRLDWRALALLGALLSIIIDWPGLVYAMPILLPSSSSSSSSTTIASTPIAAAYTENINVINVTKYVSSAAGAMSVKNSNKNNNNNNNNNNNTSEQDVRYNANMDIAGSFSLLKKQRKVLYLNENNMNHLLNNRHLTTNEKQEVNDKITHSISKHNINKNNNNNNHSGTAICAGQTYKYTNHPRINATENFHQLIEEIPISHMATTTESNIFTTDIYSDIAINTESTAVNEDEDNDNDNDNDNEKNSSLFAAAFQFSSSNHLAILSRTERSISSLSSSHSFQRSPDSVSSSSSSSSSSRSSSSSSSSSSGSSRGVRSSSSSGSGSGIVRRSSDANGVKSKRLNNSRTQHNNNNKNNLDRNERSTLSHLSGPSRKIQLYIKNRFIQLMPDGTVNGTQDDQSEYTILQRSSVDVGRIKIQGVATCLYLCMDPCGAVYGSKDFTDDCVFNENMELHNYNTYSSTYNSNARRKYYLALNRHGEPRKLQIPPTRSLGKLATYTNAITETVPQERVEQLIAKNFGANRIKHGIRQLCDTGKPLIELIDSKHFKARPKCNPNSSSSNSNNSSSSTSSSISSSSSSSSNNNSHKNTSLDSNLVSNYGQLLNNVPAANDKIRLENASSSSGSNSNSNSRSNGNNKSSSSSSSSSSNSNSHRDDIHERSSNSGTSQSSISNSQIYGHISDSATNSIQASHHIGGVKKKKKKRKCRPLENEDEHNCQRGPQALRKKANSTPGALGPKREQKCRELLLQQQQAQVAEVILPPMCNKMAGHKKSTNNSNQKRPNNNKNGSAMDILSLGHNNRRGKKLNLNGRQAAKLHPINGFRKRPKNPKRGNNNNRKKQQQQQGTTQKTITANTSPPSTSPKLFTSATSSRSTTIITTTTTTTTRPRIWETTSLLPTTTVFDNFDFQTETTSDRGEREQRNVHFPSSIEESIETSAEEHLITDNEDSDVDNDDPEVNEEIDEVSYEDDLYTASSSSHLPLTNIDAHTPLTGGAEDFLYYDQLDFLPLSLWELTALLWIIAWSLYGMEPA